MAKGHKKTGRPSIQPPSSPDEIHKLYRFCLLGATNDDIAKYLGVGRTTVDKWIANKNGSSTVFASALKRGRDEADAKVSESLYRRAIGYEHRAVKLFYDSKKRGWHLKPGVDRDEAVYPDDYEYDDGTVVAEYTERYPPSEIAAFFWLKNRQKERWRDKQELDVVGGGVPDIPMSWKPSPGCKPLRPIEEIEAEAIKEDDQLKSQTDANND